VESLVDIKRLAEILGVRPATIYGWVHDGYVPHYKLGALVRFSLEDVKQWLKDKRRAGRKERTPEIEVPARQGRNQK